MNTITNCTTLFYTYSLLLLKRSHSENIQSYHHKSKDKNNTVNKVINIELNTITNYTTLYHTYFLLYYKQHIQITYNHTNIKVERKQYSKQGKKF